jgi:hypothetical protein
MFSGFLGKGKKPGSAPVKDAVDSRGLEVVEDDPDTSWGLWENAVAEQDSRFSAMPSEGTSAQEPTGNAYQKTAPMPLTGPDLTPQPALPVELTMEQRKDEALQIVELHHHRIANTIRTLWGYKECSAYISKLILNGIDDTGHARIGFHQDAAHAMMVLADLHDAQFGPMDTPGGTGFGDFTVRTGFDWLR